MISNLNKYLNLIIYCLLFLFSFFNGYSQHINGIVVDSNNQKIASATILIKDAKNSTIVKEFILVHNGSFSIQLKKKYNKIILEVITDGYFTKSVVIEDVDSLKTYKYDFQLKKEEGVSLKEVIVTAKKKTFEIENDTVKFNVKSFSNGSERKIEEIIKKIPGIAVNPKSGEIRYNGKAIETVTLEGDNLFGYSYSIGTKNINVDMVEQVQVVNHYSENPLLNGIEQNDKIALNLQLKKGKLDFSGSLNSNIGWFTNGTPAYDFEATILGITKNFKTFSLLSYNNVGTNYSPIDYFGFNLNVEQLKEKNVNASKVIPETLFSNLLGDDRANNNNQLFGSYNSIFKVGKKISIKTNLYYLQDRISLDQLYESQYKIDNQSFSTSDVAIIDKKPQSIGGELFIKYSISKKSLLTYNVKIKDEVIETMSENIQNNSNFYNTNLKSKDVLFKQDLLLTLKISEKKALQFSILNSVNTIPQKLLISPNSLISNNIFNDTQESEFKKKYFDIKTKFLGSGTKNKYSFDIGVSIENNPFNSNLYNQDQLIVLPNIQNNFDYSKELIYQTGKYSFNSGNWSIQPKYELQFLNQKLNDKIIDENITKKSGFFIPSLAINYHINRKSFLSGNFSLDQRTNAEQYFFSNQILINKRTSYNNIPTLELQKSKIVGLDYVVNDLFNQFQFNIGANYQKTNGNFFNNTFINENTTRIEFFFLPQDSDNFNSNFLIEKYLPFFESTLKFTSNYSFSNYKNIVNNSDLRTNQSQFVLSEFFWKTALDIPINFENKFTWQFSKSITQNESNGFGNNAIQNSLNILYKQSSRFFFTLTANYFLPNINEKNNDFLFLDSKFNFNFSKKKWNANLQIKNILNVVRFEQIQTNDYSTSLYRSNLLPRCFIFNFSWNF